MTDRFNRVASILALHRQRSLLFGRTRWRWLVLVLGLVIIGGWQLSIGRHADRLDDGYRNLASIGVGYSRAFPYYRFLGFFPLAVPDAVPPHSTTEAVRKLAAAGPKASVTVYASHVMVLSYWVDAWLGHPSGRPSAIPAGITLHIIALMAVWTAFWVVRLEILGLFAVALLGSNPFQLFAAFREDDYFSFIISSQLIVFALCLPVIVSSRQPRPQHWMIAVACGLVVGTATALRSEAAAILVSALAAFALMPRLSWRTRLAGPVIVVAVMGLTLTAWGSYFRAKSEAASAVVHGLGGPPATDWGLMHSDTIWFSVWGGLGDFDDRYGHLFDDRVMHAKMAAIAAREDRPSGFHLLRDDIVRHAVSDPLWLTRIMALRFWRCLTDNTPPSLAAAGIQMPLPLHGWPFALAVLALAAGLALARHWPLLKLLAFLVPGGGPLFVMADYGIQYYATYHLLAAALLLAVIVEVALVASRRRNIGANGECTT
jgi:hypothetical protein